MKRLDVPDWVPPSVASTARDLYEQADKVGSSYQLALIQRLTHDPRMKIVWKELTKKKRTKKESSVQFFYPAEPEEPEPLPYFPKGFTDRASWLQGVALADLFRRAAWLGSLASDEAMQAGELEKIDALRGTLRDLRMQIERFTDDLSESYTDKPRSRAHRKAKDDLLMALARFDKLVDKGQPVDLRLLARKAFALGLSTIMEQLFRSPLYRLAHMYGLVAHIISVVLLSEVSADQVREWRGAPLGKLPRKKRP